MSWHKSGKARINFKEIKKGFHYFLAPRTLDNLQESEDKMNPRYKPKKGEKILRFTKSFKATQIKISGLREKNWQRE